LADVAVIERKGWWAPVAGALISAALAAGATWWLVG
jgi:hypothetical protein